MSRFAGRCFLLSVVALAACGNPATPDATAGVNFALVAPLCSSVLPIQLLVDGRVVATDTFRVAVTNPHLFSTTFAVSAGQHVLDAHVIGGYVWRSDTIDVLPTEQQEQHNSTFTSNRNRRIEPV